MAVCNHRGLVEEEVVEVWTMRRLVHAYAIIRRDSMWWLPILAQVTGSAATGSKPPEKDSPGSPQRRRADGTYVWDKQRRNVTVFENEQSLGRIAGFAATGRKRGVSPIAAMRGFMKGKRTGMGR